MTFKIKFWGVRGSLTTPMTPEEVREHALGLLEEFDIQKRLNSELSPASFLSGRRREVVTGYGGHTSCVQLTSNDKILIIDGGSGIKNFGDLIISDHSLDEYHILMTHFHWDHVLGLPFFTPLYLKGKKIHFYAVQPDLETNIKKVFTKPFHPVAFQDLSAQIYFHQIPLRKTCKVNGFELSAYQLDHPDPCYGFKVVSNGRILSYCVDHEGVRKTPDQLEEDAELFSGANTLVFDAQYSVDEIHKKQNWGHSTAAIGLQTAFREKIEQVLFVHHDPSHQTDDLLALEYETKKFERLWLETHSTPKGMSPFAVKWKFVQEGYETDV